MLIASVLFFFYFLSFLFYLEQRIRCTMETRLSAHVPPEV